MITDTSLQVPVQTLSTKNNATLLRQLKSGFKRIAFRNKYQQRVSAQTRNQYLDYVIGPSFQATSRLFASSLENDVYQRSHKRYFPPTVKINNYKVVIDGKTF